MWLLLTAPGFKDSVLIAISAIDEENLTVVGITSRQLFSETLNVAKVDFTDVVLGLVYYHNLTQTVVEIFQQEIEARNFIDIQMF